MNACTFFYKSKRFYLSGVCVLNRSDFMTLPFQAIECYMANITPLQGKVHNYLYNYMYNFLTQICLLSVCCF